MNFAPVTMIVSQRYPNPREPRLPFHLSQREERPEDLSELLCLPWIARSP
jgi:hypothetical protein